MEVTSASDVRNNLAAMLEKAQHAPVIIQKQGRNAAVLLSCEEYERLTNAQRRAFQVLCDDVGEKAAAKGLTEEKLMAILAEDKE